jgi:hypothetical protein
MPETSTMHHVHAGNATRMAIRFTEQLAERESLAVPAGLDALAVTGPVGGQLAELGWQTLATGMGEARCPQAATRAMIRAMCDHALARAELEAKTREAKDAGEAPAEPADPFAGLPVG